MTSCGISNRKAAFLFEKVRIIQSTRIQPSEDVFQFPATERSRMSSLGRFVDNWKFRIPCDKQTRCIMLHPETLEAYRRMTPSERLQLTLEMTRENGPRMFRGTSEQIERRFEILRIQNDDRNRRMLKAFARTRKNDRLRDEKSQFEKENSGDLT